MSESTRREERSESRGLRRLRGGYVGAAIFLLNVVVLFVLANLVLWPFARSRDPEGVRLPIIERYGMEKLGEVYAPLSPKEIEALLRETWSRPYAYEPFTQFKERPHGGKFVNVSEHGFRVGAGQGPWPPDPNVTNVFLFGGSTAFGYGVADGDTIGSHLQRALDGRGGRTVRVYNFGRGHYYSSQERVLFERLLAAGSAPQIAIFLDGLNEFFYSDDEPLYTGLLARVMDGTEPPPPTWIDRLPLVRAARRLLGEPAAPSPAPAKHADEAEVSRRVVDRYLGNRAGIEAVARSAGVVPVFVWQPVPMYGWDDGHHLFRGNGYGGDHRHAAAGYAYLRKLLEEKPLPPSFLWLAELQRGRAEPLYVDQVHYTAAFSRDLANAIAAEIEAIGLLPGARSSAPVGALPGAVDLDPADVRPSPSAAREPAVESGLD